MQQKDIMKETGYIGDEEAEKATDQWGRDQCRDEQ